MQLHRIVMNFPGRLLPNTGNHIMYTKPIDLKPMFILSTQQNQKKVHRLIKQITYLQWNIEHI